MKNEMNSQPDESMEAILENMAQSYVRFPQSIFGNDPMFVVTAGEDYLHDYDIHEGDTLLFRRQDTAEYGQIVCALIGDRLYMRHYAFNENKGMPFLKSSNTAVADAYDFHIIGTVAWVIRPFENTTKEACSS